MIEFAFDWITGMNLGIEFLDDEEDKQHILLIDLLIIRFIFAKGYE